MKREIGGLKQEEGSMEEKGQKGGLEEERKGKREIKENVEHN